MKTVDGCLDELVDLLLRESLVTMSRVPELGQLRTGWKSERS